MSQQINLYNSAFEKQTTLFSATAIMQSMALIVVGGLALAAYVVQVSSKMEAEEKTVAARLKQREARHDLLVAQFKPRDKNPELVQELSNAEAALKSLRGVQGMVTRGDMGNTKGYADYFRAFARQNVQGLWLTGATIVGAGKEIELKGRAMQSEMVPGFIGRLKDEPSLKGKSFDLLDISQVMQTIKRSDKSGNPVESNELAPFVEFTLQAVLLPEPAAPAAPAAAPAAALAQAPAADPVAGVAK